LIIAVPPDPVLTLDEVVELVERVVRLAVGGSSSLAVYIVIHDPALESPGAVTRHAHVLLGLREVEGTGLSRNKIRHLFAQARHAAAPNAHRSYVAEALSWPDIARDLQSTLFAEITSDAVVDPPAPFPGRHWSAKTLRHSPERRTRHDQSVDRRNFELINGDPAELVARMLRGRSVMRIDEVRRLLARFLDGADEREQRLDAILTDPVIATLANDPAEPQPRWLTTKAVHDLMRKTVAIMDRAATRRRCRSYGARGGRVRRLQRLKASRQHGSGNPRGPFESRRGQSNACGRGDRGPLALQRGQWIVYTANDYTTEHIRAGRFAKFVDACSPDVLEVIHPNGVGATLDPRLFPHVRSSSCDHHSRGSTGAEGFKPADRGHDTAPRLERRTVGGRPRRAGRHSRRSVCREEPE
jgi:hypothetical protein